MKNDVVVIKQNLAGVETWRYKGTVLKKDARSILIEAYFNRKDLPFHGIVFAEGDRFLEEYFTDRWYNIFEIHDRINGNLRVGTAMSRARRSSLTHRSAMLILPWICSSFRTARSLILMKTNLKRSTWLKRTISMP